MLFIQGIKLIKDYLIDDILDSENFDDFFLHIYFTIITIIYTIFGLFFDILALPIEIIVYLLYLFKNKYFD